MFEGLLQPMHLLVIAGLALLFTAELSMSANLPEAFG